MYIYLYIYIYINIYIYIYINSSIFIPFVIIAPLHQMKHLLSSMVYVNLEIVISPLWQEGCRFCKYDSDKGTTFSAFQNIEIFVKVLRSTTKSKLQYLSWYVGSIKSLLSLSS